MRHCKLNIIHALELPFNLKVVLLNLVVIVTYDARRHFIKVSGLSSYVAVQIKPVRLVKNEVSPVIANVVIIRCFHIRLEPSIRFIGKEADVILNIRFKAVFSLSKAF